MNSITVPRQSSYLISDESYCSPWDLKTQEEKIQLQHQTQQRHCPIQSPPTPPPIPPGGFISARLPQHNCIQRRTSLHTQAHIRNSSLPKVQISDSPTCLMRTLHGKSLQKLPQLTSVFPIVSSSCQFVDDSAHIPIERYSWYHHSISRRQAENILETCSSGSFLVRQCESGNQNDYSLSIKTTTDCMHMRINYSHGFYILGECSRPFSSVPSMIQYFTHIPVPIRGAAHIKLTKPILRWEIRSEEFL